MKISELFETKIEEKIEPVIKVGERDNDHKLASEIGSYVVTPLIEKHLDDFLEHYTDTFLTKTTEIGVWISGYFGSGKSHLAKIMALLLENRNLESVTATERFSARIPSDSTSSNSIQRSLKRMSQCNTSVMAFNLNSITDSKSRSLPELLLSQYYISKGYSGNLIYARVIEAELDKQGKLEELHRVVEEKSKKPWKEIQQNLSFYRTHLYGAASQVSPELFPTPGDVQESLKEAQRGELYNIVFLVDTILEDVKKKEKETGKPQRFLLVLDETGQWIENDSSRLSHLQALIEYSASKGQGKLWIIVTTHGDMGSIYKEARALEGDMKKIEGRFRFKPSLTTENIELVLEDRLFKKKLSVKEELHNLYKNRSGLLRGLGELSNTSQNLPPCSEDKFSVYYPFFPYQVHLMPEIVKSLRSKGGRGEQMSGSTRTLLAITQDILRCGRRNYLEEGIGTLVSFDEFYGNLSGEGEVSPDVRTEISRIKDVVPASTELTPKIAEVLYLIREIAYIPRTRDNIARLLAEHVDDDLSVLLSRIQPELQKLISAKLVAPIGEEYEFLTGERRTFEEALSTVEAQYRYQDREQGFSKNFIHDGGKSYWKKWFGSDVVTFQGHEFYFNLSIDGLPVPGQKGDIILDFTSPLAGLGGVTLNDIESKSLRSDSQNTIFFLSGRVSGFDQNLTRFLAMKEVINNWKGDVYKSEDARRLAQERENNDLPKLEQKVIDGLKEGIRTGHIIFKGSSRSLSVKQGQHPGDALRAEMTAFWAVLYPKYEKVTTRITNDQKALLDVLSGNTNLTKDVQDLNLYDKSGHINFQSPLLDAIRILLATAQNKGNRILGKNLLETFSAPPYGWDSNAVRVAIAALFRAGTVKIISGKKEYTNPSDSELIDSIRVSRNFDKVELVMEDTEIDQLILNEVRTFLIRMTKKRNIDETPSALSEAGEHLANTILTKSNKVRLWSDGSRMPLSKDFIEGEEAWDKILSLTSPTHRVREIHSSRSLLETGYKSIELHSEFQTKSGSIYTEMVNFYNQLLSMEHQVKSENSINNFLQEYKTVSRSATFSDKEVWKQLQSLKEQAKLSLETLKENWRQEARQKIEKTLLHLPEDLSRNGLDASLMDKLSEPLINFMQNIDNIIHPAQIAALPGQAEGKIQELAEELVRKIPVIEQEEHTGYIEKPVKSSRKIKYLHVKDITAVTRVTTEAEWEKLQGLLDKKVRQLLSEGYDVEL
ncbi:MAG TPA: BREX system P-loop protein BrxC [Candidatus Eremiobacteraeota bacterium]|nr:BREX system P-loop protein BrxC [Candidatus Eremiobacteraeota bacterium]